MLAVASTKRDTDVYVELISLPFVDIAIPKISGSKALALECGRFIDSVSDGMPILSNKTYGPQVVRAFEDGVQSLSQNGKQVSL